MVNKISKFLKFTIIFEVVAVFCWLILSITTNKSQEQPAVLSATYPSANYSVSVKATTLDASPYYSHIFGRIVNSNNMYGLRFSSDNARIIKKVNGSWSNLSESFEAPNNGDTITLEMNGDQLIAKYNGVIKTTITDGTFTAVGTAGVGIGYMETVNESGGMRNQILDNFAVISAGTTLFYDNFTDDSSVNLESHTPTNGGSWQKIWYADQRIFGESDSYYISQKNNLGKWREEYVKHFPIEYTTENFSFDKTGNKITLRFELKNSDFGDIEKIGLVACGEEIEPTYARYVSNRISVLAEIMNDDNWVIDSKNKPVEVSWQIADACKESAIVSLKAHEYQELKSPLKLPKCGERAFYNFENNKPVFKVDGKINEVDGLVFPQYSEWWKSGTGHPAGYTYVYVNDDKNNVYISVDITGDNTNELGKDWAEIITLNQDGITESKFRIDDNNLKYGKCSFGKTSKVRYPHQTCEFSIPKNKLTAENMRFKLNYYGTMGSIDEGVIAINSFTGTIVTGGITDYYSGAIYSASLQDDTTGPIISNVVVSTVGNTGVAVNWTTNEPATSQVMYGLSRSYGLQTSETDNDVLVTSHTAQLINLQANCTNYPIKIISKDIFSNTTADENYSANTRGCPTPAPYVQVINQPPDSGCSNQPPNRIPNIFKVITTKNTATLNFVPTNENTNGYQVLYGRSKDKLEYFTEYDQGYSSGALLYTIYKLPAGTTFYFKIRAKNDCSVGPWGEVVKAKTQSGNWSKKVFDVKGIK